MFSLFRRRNRGPFARLHQRQSLAGVLPATEFERVFLRERELSDRGDHRFALAVFLPAYDNPDEQRQLAAILRKRLRSLDAVGFIDDQRLGVLLSLTDGQGAWVFADEALHQASKLGLNLDCQIYAYPMHDRRGADDGGTGVGASSGVTSNDRAPLPEPPPALESETPVDETPAPTPSEPAAYQDLREIRPTLGPRPVHNLAPIFAEPLVAWKRMIDVVASGSALVALAPLLGLLALAVRLDSKGPVIFTQKRVGRGGRVFNFFKFRSMVVDAEARKSELASDNEKDGPIFKIKNDPRTTRVGKFIRRWSLDELPQLYNVLRGDMTLVGPRPPLPSEVPGYQSWQRKRLDMTGGLTCIWQVSGRSNVSFEDWMRMDLRYAKEKGFLKDMSLLAQTAKAVVSSNGAY